MTLLDNHLEQIHLSSTAIAELPFPPPKIFTNALLRSHDITALIRDTESHERALFSLEPPNFDSTAFPQSNFQPSQSRSENLLNGFRQSRKARQAPVAALLGGELGGHFREEGAKDGQERGEVDVEALLKGAQRLCAIYPIPGALEKIASLRARHGQFTSSIARFEARVSRQAGQLAQMNKGKSSNGGYDDGDCDEPEQYKVPQSAFGKPDFTAADLAREEEEIRELETKKRLLEERVSSMDRDLGGLMR